jgi:hypothetical protein
MTTKQSFSNEDIKTQVIKDRLTHLFKNNTKSLAKILIYLLKRHKKNV